MCVNIHEYVCVLKDDSNIIDVAYFKAETHAINFAAFQDATV